MIITFSGVDGSGKTTYARHTVEFLQKKGYNVCYLHLTQWTWVYAIGELLDNRKKNKGLSTCGWSQEYL